MTDVRVIAMRTSDTESELGHDTEQTLNHFEANHVSKWGIFEPLFDHRLVNAIIHDHLELAQM